MTSREIRGRTAKHVRGDDDAGAGIELFDGGQYLRAPLLDIVIGADADGADRVLGTDDVLGGRDECLGQATVGDNDKSDHRSCILPFVWTQAYVISVPMSRWRTMTARPSSSSAAASRSMTYTERCRPPVQPTAMVR